MPGDDRQRPQKRSGESRRDVQLPSTRIDQSGRPPRGGDRTRTTSDYLYHNTADDDAIFAEDYALDFDEPRTHTSTIRMAPTTGPARSGPVTQTGRNTNSVRRTGGQGQSPIKPLPSSMQARSNRNPPATYDSLPPPTRPPRRKIHLLLPIGVTMLCLIALWVVGSVVLAWGTARLDDFRYGTPRTYQTDQVVGHLDSAAHPSHFIAINLNRHVVIVEFMGGNPAKSVSYTGPYLFGPGGDTTPITLEFRDVNHDSKPDMIVHMQDQTVVFINDGPRFRPSNNNDNITLLN